jgi:hypothetical protein
MSKNPELTAPVSRRGMSALGIVGTANVPVPGISPSSIGGSVSNGVDSLNNVPKNPNTTIKDPSQGSVGSQTNTSASVNPKAAQDEIGARKINEAVSPSATVLPNIGTGEVGVSASTVVNTTNKTNVVNELVKAKNDLDTQKSTPNSDKIDGAKVIGDPTVQDRNGLPGGKEVNNQVSNDGGGNI